MILLLKSGPNLGSRRVTPDSPIKLLEVSFQPIKSLDQRKEVGVKFHDVILLN